MNINKSTLRQSIRMQRQQLNAEQAKQFALSLVTSPEIKKFFEVHQHFAFYWPNDGEIDPRPLLHFALANHKDCYLPIIVPPSDNKILHFVRYQLHDTLIKNRFGIPEPHATLENTIAANQLDVVFVPLTAFDSAGNRLGMGAGYYDNTFSFRKNSQHTMPLLIGLAYDFQQVSHVPHDHHDVQLDDIITNQR